MEYMWALGGVICLGILFGMLYLGNKSAKSDGMIDSSDAETISDSRSGE